MSNASHSVPNALSVVLVVLALTLSSLVVLGAGVPAAKSSDAAPAPGGGQFAPALSPTLAAAPNHGTVGTLISFSASGFAASSSLSITWSGGTVCTGTTSGSGSFGCTYPLPPTPYGSHVFTGTDAAANTASAAFSVNPSAAASPDGGPVGTVVTFSGAGYTASSAITVTWTSGTACTATSDASGSFSCSYAIPLGTSGGPYNFTATDAVAHSANARFAVTYVDASPAAAKNGTNVTFSGEGYGSAATVWVNWSDGTACTATASASGAFSCVFRVPGGIPGGPYPFTATDGLGASAVTNLSVKPSLSVTPTKGAPATTVTFTGTEYAASSLVTVTWSVGTACSGTSDALGRFSCAYSVAPATAGNHVFTGTDRSGDSATVTFKMGQAVSPSPSTGSVGSSVVFTGVGYTPALLATVVWSAGTACTATVDPAGTFSCTYVMGAAPVGAHTFAASDTSGGLANTSFTITPNLAIGPTSTGPVGSRLTLSATGFARNSPITIAWSEGTACTGTTSSVGSFACSFVVPPQETGNYSFNATDTASDNASAVFHLVTHLSVTPLYGAPGTSVAFSATGFTGGSALWINGTGTTACVGTTSLTGSFSCTFTIPSEPTGTYLFSAVDAEDEAANATFTLVGPGFYSVTFKAVGLPSGTSWSITVGSPPTTVANTTYGSAGKVRFFEANGSLPIAVLSPPGYGVAAVLGPNAPSQAAVNVSGAATFTIRFGPFENLVFNETGLPNGSHWGIAIRSSLPHGGPSPQTTNTTLSSLNFTVVKGSYKFQVIPKPSTYRAAPGHGSVGVPSHNLTKVIKFKLVYQKVLFVRSGLTSGTLWGVNVTGPLNVSLNTTGSTLVFLLENGTYNYTVWKVGSLYPHPANSSFVVVAPSSAMKIVISYTATPVAAALPAGSPLALLAGAGGLVGGVVAARPRRPNRRP